MAKKCILLKDLDHLEKAQNLELLREIGGHTEFEIFGNDPLIKSVKENLGLTQVQIKSAMRRFANESLIVIEGLNGEIVARITDEGRKVAEEF